MYLTAEQLAELMELESLAELARVRTGRNYRIRINFHDEFYIVDGFKIIGVKSKNWAIIAEILEGLS